MTRRDLLRGVVISRVDGSEFNSISGICTLFLYSYLSHPPFCVRRVRKRVDVKVRPLTVFRTARLRRRRPRNVDVNRATKGPQNGTTPRPLPRPPLWINPPNSRLHSVSPEKEGARCLSLNNLEPSEQRRNCHSRNVI